VSAAETQKVLDTLRSERFQDQAPRQVYAELLDEGTYRVSPSTMYRILAANGETGERRNQREARSHAVPPLVATKSNQVWTWDISKLARTPRASSSTCISCSTSSAGSRSRR
jgi:putative transposase